ncbi:uncharacterized protein LOC124368745 [Homalodisca vitripennis]|uniref:uncharacterized protein LOC124368745 n=1 Tax=Homalodisca vitripennis TaxID=197043 RepID=UPI001EEA5301|nr:uncharacterized protein LOC124368745 [Homalodisca vitripennis]
MTQLPAIITANRYTILDNIESTKNTSIIESNLLSQPCQYKYKTNLLHTTKCNQTINQLSRQNIELSIFSDSQGHSMSHYIEERSSNIRVLGSVMPNARIEQVMEVAVKSTGNDAVVIMGGTNNLLQNDTNAIYRSIEDSLATLNKKTPVILCTIPHRFDLEKYDLINSKIDLMNSYMRELALRLKSTYIIELEHLTRFDYTRHGLHLNRNGKIKICRQILDTLAVIFSKSFNRNKINFINGNMKHVIKRFCNDETVAFAHCISNDFGSAKQMSAGVATTFKEKFGRPKPSDCLTRDLSFQKRHNGCAVYGLITKQQYNHKPTEGSYKNAFTALVRDFKTRNFQSLVCSPMGCIRDGLAPEVFAENIVSFQIKTATPVNIISYNKAPFKKLHNGYTYNNLIQCIQNAIDELYLKLKIPSSTDAELYSFVNPEEHTPIEQLTTQQMISTTNVSILDTSEKDGSVQVIKNVSGEKQSTSVVSDRSVYRPNGDVITDNGFLD